MNALGNRGSTLDFAAWRLRLGRWDVARMLGDAVGVQRRVTRRPCGFCTGHTSPVIVNVRWPDTPLGNSPGSSVNRCRRTG